MGPIVISSIRRTVAEVLAVSVKDLFPGAFLLGGGATSLGFYYDFHFPFVFQKAFLSLIEQKMLTFSKKKISFVIKEMTPFCAKEFFLHRGEPLLASKVEDVENTSLVQVLHLGSFCDFVEEDFSLTEAEDVGVFSLQSFEDIGAYLDHGVTRIWGVSAPDGKILKEFIKKEKKYATDNHLALGKKLGLFALDGEDPSLCYWFPKGEAVRKNILQLVEEGYRHSQYCSVSTSYSLVCEEADLLFETGLDLHKFFFKHSSPPLTRCVEFASFRDGVNKDFSNGLFSASCTTLDLAHSLCLGKQVLEECISSLQFMMKILKILGFEFQVFLTREGPVLSRDKKGNEKCSEMLTQTLVSCGVAFQKEQAKHGSPVIEIRIKDAIDRLWTCSSLCLIKDVEPDRWIVEQSVLGSLEKIVALLLESPCGIPAIVAAEQMRVLAVDASVKTYAVHVAALLKREGWRIGEENEGASFPHRIAKALEDRVPYLVVVGKKEMETNTVVVRKQGSESQEVFSLEQWINTFRLYLNRSGFSELQNK